MKLSERIQWDEDGLYAMFQDSYGPLNLKREIEQLEEQVARFAPVAVADRLPTEEDGEMVYVPIVSEPPRAEKRLCVEIWAPPDFDQWEPYPIRQLENLVRAWDKHDSQIHWRRIDNTEPKAVE